MATKIIVAIGGTGARIATAFVYLAATGMINNPEETIFLYTIDKDADCGNGGELNTVLENYNAFREFTQFNIPKIERNDWIVDAAITELCTRPDGRVAAVSTYGSIAKGFDKDTDKDLELMVDFFHSADEQKINLSQGFYGDPSIGSGVYRMIEQTSIFNEITRNVLFNTISTQLTTGQDVNVHLIGSTFGGTGASLVPNIAHSIHSKFGDKNNLSICGTLMLPYYTFPSDSKNRIDPLEFMRKSITALDYYDSFRTNFGYDIVKNGNQNRNNTENPAIFDNMYLFGMKPSRSTCGEYAEQGNKQKHELHIADLLAALSIVENMNGATPRVGDSDNHLYTTNLVNNNPQSNPTINWGNISSLPDVRGGIVSFSRFAVLVLGYFSSLIQQPDILEQTWIQNTFNINKRGPRPQNSNKEDLLSSAVGKMEPFLKGFMDFLRSISVSNNDTLQKPSLFDINNFSNFLGSLGSIETPPSADNLTQYLQSIYQLNDASFPTIDKIEANNIQQTLVEFSTKYKNSLFAGLFKNVETVSNDDKMKKLIVTLYDIVKVKGEGERQNG